MEENQQNNYPEYPPKYLIDAENEANIHPEYPPKGLIDDENEVNHQPDVYPQNNQYMNSQIIDFNRNKEENSEDLSISYEIKKGFIIKTYGIVLFQLLISLIFVFLSFVPSVRDFFISEKNPFLSFFFVIFTIVTITVIIIFSCCKDIARKVPINYVLLFSFTL